MLFENDALAYTKPLLLRDGEVKDTLIYKSGYGDTTPRSKVAPLQSSTLLKHCIYKLKLS